MDIAEAVCPSGPSGRVVNPRKAKEGGRGHPPLEILN